MLVLKQSTPVDIRMGPFVAATDGVTPETGVTLAGADQAEVLKANGAATSAMAGAFAAVMGADGWYDYTVATGDVDTVGEVAFVVQDSSLCLPVFVRGYVVEEAIYDALFAASSAAFDANQRVDVAAIAGTAQTARDLGASVLLSPGTGTGQISLASGAVTAGTVSDKTGYRLSAAGVDDVWDEAIADHTTEGSFGQRFQNAQVGTATAGSATSITLDTTGRSSTTDFYKGSLIVITGGTGAGQARFCTAYDGGTGIATVGTWATNPDATSDYVIIPFDEIVGATAPTAAQVADAVWDEARADHTSEGSFGALLYAPHEGTAQAATASTITLDVTGSSSTDDFYNYAFVKIIAGTGAGQSRQVSDYNGTTKVATVSLNWTTTPSTDSRYIVMTDFGIDAATTAQIADQVWDEARSEHVTAGSFGEYVLADSTRVSGSTSAADLLEAATTGATPLPSNTTQWLGSAVAAVTQAGVPEVDVTFVGGVAQDLPTATAIATVDANVDAILVDTGTTLPATLGTPAGASLAVDIAAVQTTANAIETDTQNIQSRLPTALNNGAIVADIQRINDVAIIGDGSVTPYTV